MMLYVINIGLSLLFLGLFLVLLGLSSLRVCEINKRKVFFEVLAASDV